MSSTPDRIDILHGLNILDTPPEPDFDDLVLVAQALCRVPVALISLVDRDRQWFKARVGFEPPETPLNQSVCAHAADVEDLLVIPDLSADPRTCRNTLVTQAPHIRFYAGVPLVLDGVFLGTLCVIDFAPRPEGLSEDQRRALRALAQQVVVQIRARQKRRRWMSEIEEQNVALRVAARHAQALFRLGDSLQSITSAEDALRVGSTIMAETLDATRAGFGTVDPERETVMMQPEWRAPGVTSLAGQHSFRTYGSFIDDLKAGELVIVQDVTTDPRTAAMADRLLDIGIRVLINVPVFQHDRFVLVGFVHYDWRRPLTDQDATFIRTVADRVQSAVSHLRAVEERRIMNREMGHRLKNTFAMITAIARQTFAGQDRAALRDFSARLGAVGSAYDLLANERWEAADLRCVVQSCMSMAGGTERFVLDGPAVSLAADAALSAAMLLHELATNAMKYGALSVPEGRVFVTWTVEDGTLALVWRETGGPGVARPTRTGFGSRLIRMGLLGSGDTEMDFRPEGLHCRFDAPLARLAR